MFKQFYRHEQLPSHLQFLKMCLQTKNRANVKGLKSQIPFQKADLEKIHHPGKRPQVTWLGHSSLLLQYRGKNFLMDPVFAKRVSPISFLGPKRYTPLPLQLEELPTIDQILISHNHYDHLDVSVARHFRNRVEWVVPKGLGTWFAKKGVSQVHELSWMERYGVVTATPAKHWSKRGIGDLFASLWCSYMLEWDDFRFYFAADSGFDRKMFEEIAATFSPVDGAALPIGAYDPEWFMHPFHMTPEEAAKVHQILRSKRSIPIHWGTYALTFEPITEPLERLGEVEGFEPIAIGSTLTL